MSELTDDQLKLAGLSVSDIHIVNSVMLEEWELLYQSWGAYPNAPHKCFEHYASTMLLAPIHVLSTLLDVAADQSPFTSAVEAMNLCWNTYRQDINYEPGWIDTIVGSSASSIPLPDKYIDFITLHCSFEHFENDEDIGFLRECARLLKMKGRAVILPFYTWQTYLETPPQPSPNTGFGRFYDQQAIKSRIIDTTSLNTMVYNVYLGEEYRFRALVLTNEQYAMQTSSGTMA